jgi:CRP-like cAMP-binding protein
MRYAPLEEELIDQTVLARPMEHSKFTDGWKRLISRTGAEKRTFAPETYLFRAGDDPGVFHIESGEIDLKSEDRAATVRRVGVGEILGVVAAVARAEHPLSAVAVTETHVEYLSSVRLHEILRDEPEHWPFIHEVLGLELSGKHRRRSTR